MYKIKGECDNQQIHTYDVTDNAIPVYLCYMTSKIRLSFLPLMFVLFMHPAISLAQAGYFQVTTEQSGSAFKFPVFSAASHAGAALKINRFLQLMELQVLKGHEKSHLFEYLTTGNGGIKGTTVLYQYTLYSNNSKMVSLGIRQNKCDENCFNEIKYYNFNSGNGDLVHLKDLFTADGYNQFFNYVTNKRMASLDKEMLKLDEPSRAVLEGVKECYKESSLNDFYIKDNWLYIDGENCFYNTQKDQVVKRLDKFAATEFQQHLNDYGKSFFGLGNADISAFRSNQLPQLFEETTVSDSMLVFVLIPYYMEDMKAVYTRINKGVGIKMEGRLKGTELYLAEYETPVSETPYLNAVYENLRIAGVISDRLKVVQVPINLIKK